MTRTHLMTRSNSEFVSTLNETTPLLLRDSPPMFAAPSTTCMDTLRKIKLPPKRRDPNFAPPVPPCSPDVAEEQRSMVLPTTSSPAPNPRRTTKQWKRWWSWIPTLNLTLENSGSVARDHLASERTFLAYVRTSLALVSGGVALVQLFSISSVGSSGMRTYSPDKEFARPLGAATVSLGLIVLGIGFIRYFSTQHALTQGRFPAARLVLAGVALALGALVVAVFSILVKLR